MGAHLVENLLGLCQGLTLWRDVDIVESVAFHAELVEELEGGIDALGIAHAVAAIVPRAAATTWAQRSPRAWLQRATHRLRVAMPKGSCPPQRKRVPPHDGETAPVIHGLAEQDFICVVVLEGQVRRLAGGVIGDLRDAGEELGRKGPRRHRDRAEGATGGAERTCAHHRECLSARKARQLSAMVGTPASTVVTVQAPDSHGTAPRAAPMPATPGRPTALVGGAHEGEKVRVEEGEREGGAPWLGEVR